MPEYPEISATVHLLQRGKGFPGPPADYRSLKFIFQLVPLCLSLGSEKRSFECLNANKGDYSPDVVSNRNPQLHWLPAEWPPSSWHQRAREPWSYLLDPPQVAGKLICAMRGKLIVIAAGNHALCISLGLEAHVFGMTPKDFFDIVAQDIPGPNPDASKADQIRTFIIPERLIVPHSSSRRPRTIKIFAAFISADWVYVLSDFSGLVRMFVKSKQSPWTCGDLTPESEYWNYVFDSFKGGPDWRLEKPLAMAAICRWRIAILEEQRRWRCRTEKVQQKYDRAMKKYETAMQTYNKAMKKYKSRGRLELYFKFKPKPGRQVHWQTPTAPALPICPVYPPQPFRPISREICANSLGAFSGFGRHTMNDFLFGEAIFPGMPSYLLCDNDKIFQGFVSAIEAYLKSFATDDFYDRIVSVANSSNPFAFNEKSHEQYMKRHLMVFRRTRAKVDRDLYIRYCRLGYLDLNHTMGEDYPLEKAEAAIESDLKGQFWKMMPVYFYEGFNVYSIIEARCPPNWAGKFAPLVKKQVKKDIASFGYNTTIGLAQFHEQVLNRVPPEGVKVKRGRPSKEHTGRRGRPPKTKSTKKAKEAATAKILGRKPCKKRDDLGWADDEPVDMNTDILIHDLPDMEGTTDINTIAELLANSVEDLDDNAGDADAAGDGSAYLGGGFVDCNDREDLDGAGATSGKDCQALEVLPVQSSKDMVLGMPRVDLDGVLRNARYIIEHFHYTNNPYDPPECGIMTHSRACLIVREWHTLGLKYMKPYLTRYRLHGTTIPEKLALKTTASNSVLIEACDL